MIGAIFATREEAAPLPSKMAPGRGREEGSGSRSCFGRLSAAPHPARKASVCNLDPEAALAAALHLAREGGVQALFNGDPGDALTDSPRGKRGTLIEARRMPCRFIKGVSGRAVAGARSALPQNIKGVSRRVTGVLARAVLMRSAAARHPRGVERRVEQNAPRSAVHR